MQPEPSERLRMNVWNMEARGLGRGQRKKEKDKNGDILIKKKA